MESRFEFVEIRGDHPPLTLDRAVREGLSAQPKSLATQFLYDRRGSELFERITELPEYYPTRTERAIIEARAGEIIEAAGEGAAIIEFGSGSSTKTRLLIEAALARRPELRYMPIDISFEFLKSSSANLLEDYPGLQITALGAEYFDAADALPSHDGPRLILFLGSNIGNLTREEAVDFLTRIRRGMEPRDRMLVGIDLVKDRGILEAAYNDRQGITAAFNLNLLRRVNHELGGHFAEGCFRHDAPYDDVEHRIEMRLYSRRDQRVRVDALDQTFEFADGEFIHTEWSYKYTRETFAELCSHAGLAIEHLWHDDRNWFGLALLRVTG
ncbi:L-histidine N(alpha)-methyltransferase [Fimbriimonas ginsengisoli]|uniref:ABC transporter ATP-binding protein n=1 Tax=Fimbriimonas ginsengisoli Gsoil 348 TaxID=661478 RepID=A0A068NNT8_FIMGI|nr:L-histidine N(alpha)-methyltransferase [Fimbriimonas ginsengisoli]AIE85091.1 ABC transporter ATP-binding protein [Fimbriimonas ginsengisoli Gsoil 348]